MRKIVLIIGRFQPFHLGHLSLIERYNRAGFFIKIAIGSFDKGHQKENPLTGKERIQMLTSVMKESKIKNYALYGIRDIWDDGKYVRHVKRIVGKFDVVVTGNPSVLRLFFEYKARRPWSIESFEESVRSGGSVTATQIRRRWIHGSSRKALPNSAYVYLREIDFSGRLKKLKKLML